MRLHNEHIARLGNRSCADPFPLPPHYTPRVLFVNFNTINYDFQRAMWEHFVTHYVNIGIRPADMLFVLHVNPLLTDAAPEQEYTTILKRYNITWHRWEGEYTSQNMKVIREKLIRDEGVGPYDWIIHADGDELHEWPRPVREYLAWCDKNGYNAVRGYMYDRVSPTGQLVSVAQTPSVWHQFPHKCLVTKKLLKGNKKKIVALRAYLRVNQGKHQVDGPDPVFIDDAQCTIRTRLFDLRPVTVNHFKWVSGVIDRLVRRIDLYIHKQFDWWQESWRFMQHYQRHGMRICVECEELLCESDGLERNYDLYTLRDNPWDALLERSPPRR